MALVLKAQTLFYNVATLIQKKSLRKGVSRIQIKDGGKLGERHN